MSRLYNVVTISFFPLLSMKPPRVSKFFPNRLFHLVFHIQWSYINYFGKNLQMFSLGEHAYDFIFNHPRHSFERAITLATVISINLSKFKQDNMYDYFKLGHTDAIYIHRY